MTSREQNQYQRSQNQKQDTENKQARVGNNMEKDEPIAQKNKQGDKDSSSKKGSDSKSS